MNPASDSQHATPQIAIAGGGFSGAMTAVHLARATRASSRQVHITIFDPRPNPGIGRAYATDSPSHLLNVRAASMSAFPDDPEHFLRWARERDPAIAPSQFLPRPLYGRYLAGILRAEIADSGGWLRVESEAVVDAVWVGSRLRLRLASGGSRDVDRLVLATGYPLPAAPLPVAPSVVASGGYRADPWDPRALDGLAPENSLLLLGSGLTAVDLLLEARRIGVAGPIHFLSRRGLLPLAHAATGAAPGPCPLTAGRPLLESMQRLRDVVREADGDWRAVFDSLRPETQRLWQALDPRERRRFLRHVRPYWEVHRHRVAPDVADHLRGEIEEGRARVHAGWIVAIEPRSGGMRATVRPRNGGAPFPLDVTRVINCTGPNTGIEMCDSELTRALFDRGICRPDDLGIGIRCDDDGAVVGNGESGTIFALGPLRKGDLWESTAVPELRAQAVTVAHRVLQGLRT